MAEKKQYKRWTSGRKKEVVLRLLQGAPLEELSREYGVEAFRIEQWRDQVVGNMEILLADPDPNNPLLKELEEAKRCIGEIQMQNELLRKRAEERGVFWIGRSKK